MRFWAPGLVLLLSMIGGCSQALLSPSQAVVLGEQPIEALENPLFVSAGDRDLVWMQVVDTIDNYFQIASEDRVRVVGGVLTVGHIETVPLVGSTLLEPWRRDSVPGFERLHGTLQSIRRTAEVRVIPVAEGYSIEVIVIKELEDVSHPEHATVGSATLRHDGSLVRVESGPESVPATLGWISLGRDPALEQEILTEIQARLSGPGVAW